MKNITFIIQKLDSIKQNLINVNARLDNIDEKIIPDNLFKIAAIATPIIVGVVIFILTKNKEVLFKKSELAGEIFMRLFELKKLRTDYEYCYLNKCALDACMRLKNQQNIDMKSVKKMLDIDETDKLEQIKSKIDLLAKELMKYIGQYKFYINKKNKLKLEQITVLVGITHQKYELFENCNSVQEIFNKQDRIMLNLLSPNNLELKFQQIFNEIERIISGK